MAYDIVAGLSADIEFQLLESGAPIDLTNITVSLLVEDRTGTTVSPIGTVSITDTSNGKIKLTPTSSTVFDAARGPYFARWQLVDTNGKISYVPSSNRDMWNIVGR